MARRKAKDKQRLLEELEENPLITRACRKLNIGRATFYKWCSEDPLFKIHVEWAQNHGRSKVNDFVESKLLENINAGMQSAIVFWLAHNHPSYIKPTAQEFDELRNEVRLARAGISNVLDIVGEENSAAIIAGLNKSKIDPEKAQRLKEENEKSLRRFI